MHNVIILHSNWNALSVVHELCKVKNVNIYVIDSKPGIASKSKYIENFFKVTNPMTDDLSTINEISSIIDYIGQDVLIIPSSDHWAMMLSKYRNNLSDDVKCLVAKSSTVDLLINKKKFYNWAFNRGYSVPSFVDITTPIFPLVAKFEYRRKSSSANEQQLDRDLVNMLRVVFINNQCELENYLNTYKEYLRYIIFQEYIAGDASDMHTIGVFSVNGEIKTLFSGKKTRGFPADVGDCIVGEVKKCPNYVLSEVIKIISDLKYTGIAEVEYKVDINTNKFRLIEINPRTWSWIGITSCMQECNLIRNAYEYYCLNKSIEYTDSLSVNDGSVRFIRIYEDFINNCFRYSRDVKVRVSIIDWFFEFKRKKNYIPDFLERRILFYSTYYFIKNLIKSVLKGLSGHQ